MLLQLLAATGPYPVVKIVGVGYLLWLGVQALRSATDPTAGAGPEASGADIPGRGRPFLT